MSALSNAHPGQICRDVFHVEQNLRRLCFTWNIQTSRSILEDRSMWNTFLRCRRDGIRGNEKFPNSSGSSQATFLTNRILSAIALPSISTVPRETSCFPVLALLFSLRLGEHFGPGHRDCQPERWGWKNDYGRELGGMPRQRRPGHPPD
jgi:hypothetical protein